MSDVTLTHWTGDISWMPIFNVVWFSQPCHHDRNVWQKVFISKCRGQPSSHTRVAQDKTPDRPRSRGWSKWSHRIPAKTVQRTTVNVHNICGSMAKNWRSMEFNECQHHRTNSRATIGVNQWPVWIPCLCQRTTKPVPAYHELQVTYSKSRYGNSDVHENIIHLNCSTSSRLNILFEYLHICWWVLSLHVFRVQDHLMIAQKCMIVQEATV